MAQSVDVNALFDRIALLVTEGVSDPDVVTLFNGIDIVALSDEVGIDTPDSVYLSTGIYRRIRLLEGGITSSYISVQAQIKEMANRIILLEGGVVNIDTNTYIDGTSYVVMDATSGDATTAWDDEVNTGFTPVQLFDDYTGSFARLRVDYDESTPDKILFFYFDAGRLIDTSGFAIQPFWPDDVYDDGLTVPQITRLMAKVYDTDPWTTITTLTLDSQPTTMDAIQKLFAPVTYQYFRFEFDAIFKTFNTTELCIYELATVKMISPQLSETISSELLDPTPFTFTATSTLWTAEEDPYLMWDGNLSTVPLFKMDVPEPEGIVFIEFDAGAAVSVGGFIMRFHPDSYRKPQDVVMFSGTSTSGPWTQIGTSEGISFSSKSLTVTFPQQSVRYFRVVFSNPAGGLNYPAQAKLMSWSTFDLINGTINQ